MSAVTDLFGAAGDSSGSAPSQYNTWQPQYTSGMDTNFNSAINNNFNSANNTSPYWARYLNSATNNPYAQGAQNAANQAGAAYTNTGNQALVNSNALSNASNTLLNNSFDPQNQIYNTQLQNNTDATDASLAARGLNTSGVGADLANQSNINFNEGWQNNLLNRQGTGVGAAASGFANAGQQGTSGAQSLYAGGQTPLNAYMGNNANLANGLNTYGQGSTATENQALGPLMQYLNLGASQSNAQGNFDQQYWQNQMDYTQNQNALNNNVWGAIGNIGSGAIQGSGATSPGGFFDPITWA